MDFLEFLRENSNTWTSNRVVFNGGSFRLNNDTFPRFELVGGRVRECLGDYTPYSLSSSNTWGGDSEYSVLKNGTTTGYNIKVCGGYVEIFSAGVRYYDDAKGEESTQTADTTHTGSSTYESSSGYIQNPYGKWACYGLVSGGLVMLLAMILLGWWSAIVYAMIIVTWFFSITWNYLFESKYFKRIHQGFEDKTQSFSKPKKVLLCIARMFLIFAPTIILNAVGVLLVVDSEMVVNIISRGVLISLYIVFYLYNIFAASYLFHSEYHGIELINEYILPIIMAVANCVMMILFGVGFGL